MIFRRETKAMSTKVETFNPMLAFLYFRIALKAWNNYTLRVLEKRKECEANNISYESSETEESEDSDYDSSDDSDEDDSSSYFDDDDDIMEEIPEDDSDENSDKSESEKDDDD